RRFTSSRGTTSDSAPLEEGTETARRGRRVSPSMRAGGQGCFDEIPGGLPTPRRRGHREVSQGRSRRCSRTGPFDNHPPRDLPPRGIPAAASAFSQGRGAKVRDHLLRRDARTRIQNREGHWQSRPLAHSLTMNSPSILDIVRRCQANSGDREAFDLFYRSLFPYVRLYVRAFRIPTA